MIKYLLVSFDLGSGGFNQRYPTLCGQSINTDGSLIGKFRFLIQIYWLIMNGFALVLEDLEDFPFAFFSAITFLLARVIFYAI